METRYPIRPTGSKWAHGFIAGMGLLGPNGVDPMGLRMPRRHL